MNRRHEFKALESSRLVLSPAIWSNRWRTRRPYKDSVSESNEIREYQVAFRTPHERNLAAFDCIIVVNAAILEAQGWGISYWERGISCCGGSRRLQ